MKPKKLVTADEPHRSSLRPWLVMAGLFFAGVAAGVAAGRKYAKS